jgi:hypothetical protein
METTIMAANTTTPKTKRRKLSKDQDLLKKLLTLLERDKLTKEELAEKLELDGPKQINDGLLLAAVKLAGNSNFLSNIIENNGGGRRTKKGPEYSAKKGLVVPAWILQEKGIAEGQKYEVTYGIRTGIVTLKPII